jgi:RimJ/RimL family protein N-acetyltransferase
MSYWTFPAFRGRGLASRAAQLASAYAFAELGVERIELHIEVDNMASRRVARKAGFSEEGILRSPALIGGQRRDMVVYSRLGLNARGVDAVRGTEIAPRPRRERL